MSAEQIDFSEPSKPHAMESYIIDNFEDARPEQISETSFSADPVRDYLRAIGKIPLIDAATEVELAKRIEAGKLAEHVLSARNAPDLSTYLAQMETSLHEQKAHTSSTSHKKIMANSREVQEVVGRLAQLGSLDDETLEWLTEDGRQAFRHFQEANLRLVVSIAKRHTGRGMPFLDIIQEGNLGLRHAIEMFDYTKGYKFSTYGTLWISQTITRAMFSQARTIRLPVHLHEEINRLRKVSIEMEKRLGREPTNEELATELNAPVAPSASSPTKNKPITAKKIAEIKGYSKDVTSLEKPVGDGGAGNGQTNTSFGDLIEDIGALMPADSAEFRMLQKDLQEILDTLNPLDPREAEVVKLRYGLVDGKSKTFEEIGLIYGVTRERIRQLEAKAMAKLRHPSITERLDGYLG